MYCVFVCVCVCVCVLHRVQLCNAKAPMLSLSLSRTHTHTHTNISGTTHENAHFIRLRDFANVYTHMHTCFAYQTLEYRIKEHFPLLVLPLRLAFHHLVLLSASNSGSDHLSEEKKMT